MPENRRQHGTASRRQVGPPRALRGENNSVKDARSIFLQAVTAAERHLPGVPHAMIGRALRGALVAIHEKASLGDMIADEASRELDPHANHPVIDLLRFLISGIPPGEPPLGRLAIVESLALAALGNRWDGIKETVAAYDLNNPCAAELGRRRRWAEMAAGLSLEVGRADPNGEDERLAMAACSLRQAAMLLRAEAKRCQVAMAGGHKWRPWARIDGDLVRFCANCNTSQRR